MRGQQVCAAGKVINWQEISHTSPEDPRSFHIRRSSTLFLSGCVHKSSNFPACGSAHSSKLVLLIRRIPLTLAEQKRPAAASSIALPA